MIDERDPGYDLINAISDHVTTCRLMSNRLYQYASALSMTGARDMAVDLRQMADALRDQSVCIQRTHSQAQHTDLASSEAFVGSLLAAVVEGCLVAKGASA